MYGGKTALGVVTARGGSKTVRGKNLRELAGRPLVQWATTAALSVELLDRIILSSDSPKIVAAADAVGCEAPFLRPQSLATDESESIDVVHHALANINDDFDYVVLIQPTSPFVSSQDINQCLMACVDAGVNASVSGTRTTKHPQWMYRRNGAGTLLPMIPSDGGRVSRRQDLGEAFALNGAVFVARSNWVKTQRDFLGPDTFRFIMPPERSADIDTEFDFTLAEAIADKISQ